MYSDYTIIYIEKSINLNSVHVYYLNSSLAGLKKSVVSSNGHGVR